jgi:hypothetical protein
MRLRHLPLFAIVIAACLAAFTAQAGAEVTEEAAPPVADARVPFEEGATPQALTRAVDSAPSVDFRLSGGTQLHVASLAFDREQETPIVGVISALPHGSELASLKVYAATGPEESALCGEGTMACYDPVSERMVISAETEEVDGISRASVVAHEYGHHIANNRAGGIWSAFDAGTLRWSTYERVCERTREGLAFPGNEGAHYWENPGEAFAQSYSQMVDPQSTWNYSPLFAPTPTSLRKLREDVEDPVEPTESVWSYGEEAGPGAAIGIGEAVPLGPTPMAQELKVPYDGRIRVRLRAHGGHYRLTLVDPAGGETVAEAGPGAGGVTRLRYADCGLRTLRLVSTPLGSSDAPFSARIKLP